MKIKHIVFHLDKYFILPCRENRSCWQGFVTIEIQFIFDQGEMFDEY